MMAYNYSTSKVKWKDEFFGMTKVNPIMNYHSVMNKSLLYNKQKIIFFWFFKLCKKKYLYLYRRSIKES